MRIIIDGAGEVGSHLAKMLRAESNSVTVVDDQAERLEKLAAEADVETLQGAPTSIETLKQAGAGKADLFIAVYPQAPQDVNIMAAVVAKQLGAAKVVARINNEELLDAENKLLFKGLGIEMMVYPEKSAADEIVGQLRHSSSGDSMDFARGKLQMAAYRLDEDSPLLDMTLSEFVGRLSDEHASQFRIIAISRDGKTLIPNSETIFHFGDVVYVISKREGIQALSVLFGKEDVTVKKVMIVGGSSIAAMVAESFAKAGINVKIIEKDRERCIVLNEKLSKSIEIVIGDGRNSDFLFEENIGDCDAFIALTGNDETNILACVVARKFGVPRTVAEVENTEYIRLAEEMGVGSIINKKLIMAGRIFRFTLSGKARFVKYMSGTDAEVIEYTAGPGSAITKAPLKDIAFPPQAIIGGVIRGNDALIAVGSTVIEAYDRVAVFALPTAIKDIDKLFKNALT